MWPLLLTSLCPQAPALDGPSETPLVETVDHAGADADGLFDFLELRASARMAVDSMTTSASELSRASGQQIENGRELRRFRVNLEGELGPYVDWRTQWDLTEGDTFLLDWWGQVEPWQDAFLRFGRFREPFGLEAMVSSKYLAFLERSAPIDALTPGRASGVLLDSALGPESLRASLGVFSPAETYDEELHEDALHATARLVYLPIDEPHGERLLHLGAGWHRRESLDGSESFSARPSAHLAPSLVDTGSFSADSVQVGSLEFLWIEGPLSLQAEALFAQVARPRVSDAGLGGGYLQACWSITGEARGYSRSKHSPKSIRPARGIREGGSGAFELALRHSWLDLNSAGVEGGELRDSMLGLNWYASSELRVMLDWVHTQPSPATESAELFLMRLQLDF